MGETERFAFRLAVLLGKHIHEIESLPAPELQRWRDYFGHVDPMPNIYLAAAVGAQATLAANWTGKGKPPSIDDLGLRISEPVVEETPEQTLERLSKQFGVSHGKKG